LPDTPGDEVLRRLWEDTRTREIPVAVLTADATLSQSRRLIATGAKAYLTKPLDVSRMLALIDERLTH
jgi:CheY-like chemotaxis protein